MKWDEARNVYVNKWILFEAIEAYSKEGKRIVEEISVINSYEEGKEALKEYAEKHKRDKSREMYVYHTKHEELFIEERTWIGVRKNGIIGMDFLKAVGAVIDLDKMIVAKSQ